MQFLIFLVPSEKYYNLQSLWITLYKYKYKYVWAPPLLFHLFLLGICKYADGKHKTDDEWRVRKLKCLYPVYVIILRYPEQKPEKINVRYSDESRIILKS